MGLLVFVRNLLLALCLFLVLGFLYYSAWKLHFFQWEDSKYDRLGFLLKLDSKLPVELATKYANFSEGACKPGYASALMTAIFPRFSKPAPMFLDDSFRKWARIREFVPPFGIKGQDNLIKAILSVTKQYRLTPALDSLSCRRCIIVGNGGVLANKSLGSRIDDYDIVVRVHRTASGNLWPLEYPRSPLRFAFSTRISSRKLPSPSLDCPSTMVSWAVGISRPLAVWQ
uniref:ST3 beta-galactoside alpha-2,3-sialyltransferase 3 n=1 Tax=Rousettus aegyptiacus TaxID=9407 RepID=A0A7J8KHI4_ROUAE|nr:ST3 beta-galactoside alpha-2,3-sialyltransferase 3 [Rousettus aegyptiacus]